MSSQPDQEMKAKPNQWKLFVSIFWSFFKIGPVTFGGGYAMIPLIEREVVTRRKWISDQEISEVLAVSESVPGAIAINSATFIGYRVAGIRGAIAAMTGILFPTFILIIFLAMLFLHFQDHPLIEAAFEGIRPAIVALITYAAYKIGKTAVLDKTTLVMIGLASLILLFLPIHPVFVILGGAVGGMFLVRVRSRLGWTTKLKKEEDRPSSKNIHRDLGDH